MSEPIRVLHVFLQMNRGGAETMIMNLYRNIDRTKVQFDFIVHTNSKCDYDDEILSLGGKIYSAPRFSLRYYYRYRKFWRMFFDEHPEYRTIHGHVRSSASVYLVEAKYKGLTTIIHNHSMFSQSQFARIGKCILKILITSSADYLFACSKSAGEWLYGKKACLKENFQILSNAIEVEKYIFNSSCRKKIREQMGIEANLVIGHIGSFRIPKNHDFLIDIFKAVLQKESSAILLLVGDGELRANIEHKIKQLKLIDNTILTGVRPDIPQLLSAMDILVFPSLWEGLPVTLVEAQASGLPCIASDVITDEVFVSPYIQSVSLQKSAEEWADIILSVKNNVNRECSSNYISEGDFDVRDTSVKMTAFYLNHCGGQK